jgi:hypothetical protein
MFEVSAQDFAVDLQIIATLELGSMDSRYPVYGFWCYFPSAVFPATSDTPLQPPTSEWSCTPTTHLQLRAQSSGEIDSWLVDDSSESQDSSLRAIHFCLIACLLRSAASRPC